MFRAQTLQSLDDFVLRLLHSIGDHTRGLFEAEASIAVSAAHPFENVEIVFFAHDVTPENPTCCVVMDSTALAGTPFSSTVTRTRTKRRQLSPKYRTYRITKAFSVTSPGGS